jgi:hypothetical protein
MEEEPIEMIKSFSQPQGYLRRSSIGSSIQESQLIHSAVVTPSRMDQKSRYSNEFQQLLDDSEKLTFKKSRFKLIGGTMIEKEKINEEIMRQERK